MKSFLTRLGSGILLVAIILVTGAYGSWPLWIAVTLAGFVGLHEFYRAVDIQKNDLLWWIGMIGTGMWAFIEWIVCGGDLAWKENLWMTLVITLMLFLAVYVFSFPKYVTRKITEAYFGILYVPVMLSFIYQTRMLEDGFQLVWLIFLSAWGCDTWCLLHRCAHWQTQAGAGVKPEEIHRRCRRRRGGQLPFLVLCSVHWQREIRDFYAGNLWSRRGCLPDR